VSRLLQRTGPRAHGNRPDIGPGKRYPHLSLVGVTFVNFLTNVQVCPRALPNGSERVRQDRRNLLIVPAGSGMGAPCGAGGGSGTLSCLSCSVADAPCGAPRDLPMSLATVCSLTPSVPAILRWDAGCGCGTCRNWRLSWLVLVGFLGLRCGTCRGRKVLRLVLCEQTRFCNDFVFANLLQTSVAWFAAAWSGLPRLARLPFWVRRRLIVKKLTNRRRSALQLADAFDLADRLHRTIGNRRNLPI